MRLDDTAKFQPTAYRDLRSLGETYRDGQPVLLDLTDTSDADAKRFVDVSAGLVFHARGSMDKVSSRVFILTPPLKNPKQRDLG
ncbi:uncharacterized protein DUF552 [Lentzea flaviverrucosa]|uniref:Cell division inhibitor SepF n=1 Tax=Lentzea flaviverrucosa TaxID=200379 RepID=A0A1H9ERZ4_9PSEU|nr:uncharacterized protein DUF552 [Lentzea flaviverrucosa]SEQ27768.1 cell division inhibitor SepF [Lentzea flaviverrucosa]